MIRVAISSRFVRHLCLIKGEDMQIFVDADACPVVGIVEKVAKEHSVPVTCCVIPIMCYLLITVR